MTILNLMEMALNFSKGLKNTVGKEEIARYDTILTFDNPMKFLENILEKMKKYWLPAFSLFPHSFLGLPFQKQILGFFFLRYIYSVVCKCYQFGLV